MILTLMLIAVLIVLFGCALIWGGHKVSYSAADDAADDAEQAKWIDEWSRTRR